MTDAHTPDTNAPITTKMKNPRTCTAVYAIFVVAMIAPLLFVGYVSMAVSFAALTIAIIVAYAKQDEARGTVYESHIRWLIRTFWIGGGIYLPILTLIGSVYIFRHLDYQIFTTAAQNGAAATPAEVATIMAQHYKGLFINTTRVTGGIFTLWWVLRCLSGYLVLRRNKAIANPTSWI